MDAQLSVKRAEGVLGAAAKHNMLAGGVMPESDADKIVEAEKVIELARQARKVAEQIGEANVPNFQAVIDVLFEAEAGLGIGAPTADVNGGSPAVAEGGGDGAPVAHTEPLPPESPAAPPPAPTEQPVAGEFHVLDRLATNERIYTHVPCDGKESGSSWMVPLDDVPMPVHGSTWECPGCSLVAPIVRAEIEAPTGRFYVYDQFAPQAPPSPAIESAVQQMHDQKQAAPDSQPPAAPDTPSGMMNGERWVDAQGNEWDILSGSGTPQIEARAVSNNEVTTLPAGFLKMRSPNQPPPSQPQPPAPLVPAAPEPPQVTEGEIRVAPDGYSYALKTVEVDRVLVTDVNGEPKGYVDLVVWVTWPLSLATQAPAQAPQQPAEAPVDAEPASASWSAPIIDDDEGDETYGNLLAHVSANYMPSAMPVPADLERPPAAMPDDLTAIPDIQARALHSQFNALASRARYLQGLEAAKARACERVLKQYMKVAMREARATLGKDASVTEVSQLAEENDGAATWIRRRDIHADRADAYKTFREMYSEDVSVLSRDWTMREIEQKGS